MVTGGQHSKDFILFYVCFFACLSKYHTPVQEAQEADTLAPELHQLGAKLSPL